MFLEELRTAVLLEMTINHELVLDIDMSTVLIGTMRCCRYQQVGEAGPYLAQQRVFPHARKFPVAFLSC